MDTLRVLYLECNMGAAGDMLLGALSELLPDQDAFFHELNAVGIPNVEVFREQSVKCGVVGTHVRVVVHGTEEEAEPHEHFHHDGSAHPGENGHGHHHHHHAALQDIYEIIGRLRLSEEEKTDVKQIYRSIAEAEGKVHGREVSDIHFHEVGTADAIADITGCVMLMRRLGVDRVAVSPISTGFGQVRCAHGILPVPAPAAALLLSGMPCRAGDTEGELCTPTGAALLRYFTKKYGRPDDGDMGGMPPMRIEKIGYGMGKKDFAAANCLRAILGQSAAGANGDANQAVELNCNLDDMTPEELGYAQEVLLKEGALEVFTTAVGMKKSRMGILLTVLCKPEEKEKFTELIFRHTSTIGIRAHVCERTVLKRVEQIRETGGAAVRVKISEGFGVTREKPEYEDLKKIAEEKGISLREVKKSL